MNSKRFLFGAAFSVMMLLTAVASADSNENKLRVGVGASIGVPSGASVGLVVSPWLQPLKLEGDISNNAIAWGGRGALTWDILNFPITPSLTGEFGAFGSGTIPQVKDSPNFSYSYQSGLVGLEMGKRTGFRFYFRGGISHIDATASGFDKTFKLPTGISVSDPKFSGTIPTAALGFQWLF